MCMWLGAGLAAELLEVPKAGRCQSCRYPAPLRGGGGTLASAIWKLHPTERRAPRSAWSPGKGSALSLPEHRMSQSHGSHSLKPH